MGFYIRKSVRVGPLRFNLSKSGIGVSAGIRGFRIGSGPRGNYVHIGSGGFYYRQSLPVADPERHRNRSEPDTELGVAPTHGPMETITSGATSKMVDSSSAGLLSELEEKRKRSQLWPFAVIASVVIVLGLAVAKVSPWITIPIGVLCGAVVFFAVLQDRLKKSVVVMYDLDEGMQMAFERLYSSVMEFARCGGTWHISARGRVHDPKYHAGAGHLLSRNRMSVDIHDPPYLKTNISPMRIPLGGRSMYFFPDRVLVYGHDGIGAISYDEIRFDIASSRFIEDGGVPHDARVVDRTWKYVNKDGGPDRRFSSNRELPVCLYEEIRLNSCSGLNEILQVSRAGLGAQLDGSVRALAEMIDTARTAEIERQRRENERRSREPVDAIVQNVGISFDRRTSVPAAPTPSTDDICFALLRILCCMMVADGRASRSERVRIHEIMDKAKAPWTGDVVNQNIDVFIHDISVNGYRKVLAESLSKVPMFKQIGRTTELLQCIEAIASTDVQFDDRERALCDRIKGLLAC